MFKPCSAGILLNTTQNENKNQYQGFFLNI